MKIKNTPGFIIFILFIAMISGCLAGKETGIAGNTVPAETVTAESTGQEETGGTNSVTEENTEKEQVKTITDIDGTEVTLPEKVTKVAVAGALNQMVLILGQPEKIAATAEAVKTSFFATVYPGIKNVTAAYLGTGKGELNMETLLSAKPQVVFGIFSDDLKQTLDAAGISPVAVSMNDPEEIKQTVMIIAQVLGDGAEKKAEEFNRYYDSNISMVREKTKDAQKVRVFVAGGDGSEGTIATINANDIHNYYIDSAGGTNIVAEQPKSSTGGKVQVDFEYLYEEQPDVIVVTARDAYDTILSSSGESQWNGLKAVKEGKVYLVPKGVYLWSVRSCEGALQPLWLASILHPELFPELNIREETKKFYKNFYHYDLTEEEADMIFNQETK